MSESDMPGAPAAYESRAFFAAMLAAVKGDDAKAAEILRSIADNMAREFTEKGEKGRGRRKG